MPSQNPEYPLSEEKPLTREEYEDPRSKYRPTTWGNQGSGLIELTCPSGQLCLARRPGVNGLIEAGVLNDLDSLTAIVNEKHISRVKGEVKIDTEGIVKDKQSLDSVFHMMDRIVTYVVVEPKISMTPNDVTTRKPDVIYTDMIALEDRMFIMNFAVGGTRDIESFRAQYRSLVGGMEFVKAVPETSE